MSIKVIELEGSDGCWEGHTPEGRSVVIHLGESPLYGQSIVTVLLKGQPPTTLVVTCPAQQPLAVVTKVLAGLIYVVGKDNAYISCPKCGWLSYSKGDVSNRYCGRCNQFHDHLAW